jgi:HK97 family phage major capsid protein
MDRLSVRSPFNDQLVMRSFVPQPDTYDEKTHSLEAILASEAGVEVFDWDELEVVREYLLMEGMTFPENGQIPLLDSHNRWSVESVLGSARDFADVTTADGVKCKKGRLFFSSTEEGASAEMKTREGHLTDLSIGYRVLDAVKIPAGEKALINGREFLGPCKVARRTLVKEVSLTPVGADALAKARMVRMTPELQQLLLARGLSPSASFEEMVEFMKREAQTTQRGKGTQMTPEEIAAQKKAEEERKAAEVKALEEARAKAEKEAEERINSILTTADKFRSDIPDMDALKTQALTEKWTSERFNREVLDRMAKPKPANPPAAPTATLRDYVKPWQRRAIHLLHAKTYQACGNNDMASRWQQKYDDEVRAMSQVQRDAEDAEAIEKIRASGLSEYQQIRLMSTISGTSTGAYLVPAPLLAEVFILVEKWGVARRYFRSIPMTADSLKLDSLVTEATAYWVTQGNNITASDIVFGQGTLSVAKLAGISTWTSEVDEDSAVAYLPIFTASLARAIAKKEDLAGFIGDGTSTYGGFTGLLEASTNIVTMDTGKIAFTDAVADDYKALRDAVNIDFRMGAMWWLSPSTVSGLEGEKDKQGRYIYREPAAGLPAMLWGYPIADSVGINALTKSTAAATKFAAFGNPSYMLMAVRRQLDLVVSREGVIDNGTDVLFNALQADGAIVRMTERIGFKSVLTTGFSVLKTASA